MEAGKENMTQLPNLVEMLKAGVHFGHRVSRRHPKMDPFIFGEKQGVSIINLEETTKRLKESLDFAREVVAQGGIILFLGTKKQAQSIIKKYAEEAGMPYVIERWLGGTLTNFRVISKIIKKYKNLKEKKSKGELEKYTKKEQLEFQREIERLEKMVGGIENLDRIPEAIFILDIRKEDTAIKEANRKKVPIIAVCDTNTNPELIDYPIPANDDATKSIELLVKLVAETIKEGKSKKIEEEVSP